MKTIGIILLTLGIMFAIFRGAIKIYANYDYVNEIYSDWDLADRASTIAQKSEYINRFVGAIEKQGLNGLNANLIFITNRSDFSENLRALKSLQGRLNTIIKMDENSFAYQAALQQITEQEQGGASNMLDVIEGCWYRKNYYTIWNPIIVWTFLMMQAGLIILGIKFIQR